MKYKSVLHQSGELLAHFNQNDKPCFSHEDAALALPNAAKATVLELLSAMVERRLLMRVKKGLYYIIPYEQDPDSFMPDWHLLVPHLVGDAQYYIGYYSAMQIHSLITQPALKEQIIVNKQIKPAVLKIKGIPFQFIYHNEKHFFGYKKTWIDSFHKIESADLEKTFIDALFKPEYAGGITEISKALHRSKEKIDFAKLTEYALRFDSLAVSKRLGYLLELLQMDSTAIDTLQRLATKSYFLIEPSHPKTGKMLARWNIQENIDIQSVLSAIFS
jgi:predicted transcriptional regulator of viral defense system